MRRGKQNAAGRRFLLLAALGLGAVFTAFVAAARPQDCPTSAEFLSYRPPEATRVFASDGSRLADLSPERRVVVDLDAVPRVLREGFIAVEDRRFRSHEGVDLRGMLRAVWRDVRAGSLEEGFSTITMQLARSTFAGRLPRGKSLRRKVCEVSLALTIERKLEKNEILRRYLNQVYMGDGVYGVEAAARAWFNEPAAELDDAESALLIGLIKNPEGYNPRRHPERAIARRNVVLDVMAREGVIEVDELGALKARPLRLAPPVEAAGPAPWAIAAVRAELRARFGPDADTRGLRVHTGIEPDLQSAAQEALVEQIEAIEAGRYGRYRHEAAPAELEPANGNGSPWLQGMVLVLDSHTGDVRAVVGGRDFVHSSYDRAFTALRQPGSAFKPIVYAAALRRGLTLADQVDVTPIEMVGRNATWRPADAQSDSSGTLGVRAALARSSNNAAVRVGEFAGVHSVIELAREIGISTPIPPYPSIFLGAAEVNAAEFVAAYAAMTNGGLRVTPRFIHRVENSHGDVVWEASDLPAERVLDETTAFLTTSAMRDVVDRGTGTAVRATFALPAAGKTGTTNDGKDVWFVGSTPDLTAGVWIGFDEPRPIIANATGGRLAAPVWARIMDAAYRSRPVPAPWSMPPGVVRAPVDAVTGQLATGRCPYHDIVDEYFVEGTEPREFCRLHGGSGLERLIGGLLRSLRRVF
jgi:penicillin-binding protein 1A